MMVKITDLRTIWIANVLSNRVLPILAIESAAWRGARLAHGHAFPGGPARRREPHRPTDAILFPNDTAMTGFTTVARVFFCLRRAAQRHADCVALRT
ncbi:hypothetical protein [Burkholderia alba]|uniref:hypothetical protein n=1 Tax=Burkholderia alba TaxID=2683677 RepID=UPI002B059E60|nr:hypothetical protein [Burkholderia alba]